MTRLPSVRTGTDSRSVYLCTGGKKYKFRETDLSVFHRCREGRFDLLTFSFQISRTRTVLGANLVKDLRDTSNGHCQKILEYCLTVLM